MRELVSPLDGFRSPFGVSSAGFVLTDPPTVAEDMTFQNTGAIFEGNLSIWDSGAARGVTAANKHRGINGTAVIVSP